MKSSSLVSSSTAARRTSTFTGVFRAPLNTDRWFYGVYQSAPDLIRCLAGPDDRSLADQPVPTDLDRQDRF
jgi:hypothetical protein